MALNFEKVLKPFSFGLIGSKDNMPAPEDAQLDEQSARTLDQYKGILKRSAKDQVDIDTAGMFDETAKADQEAKQMLSAPSSLGGDQSMIAKSLQGRIDKNLGKFENDTKRRAYAAAPSKAFERESDLNRVLMREQEQANQAAQRRAEYINSKQQLKNQAIGSALGLFGSIGGKAAGGFNKAETGDTSKKS